MNLLYYLPGSNQTETFEKEDDTNQNRTSYVQNNLHNSYSLMKQHNVPKVFGYWQIICVNMSYNWTKLKLLAKKTTNKNWSSYVQNNLHNSVPISSTHKTCLLIDIVCVCLYITANQVLLIHRVSFPLSYIGYTQFIRVY